MNRWLRLAMLAVAVALGVLAVASRWTSFDPKHLTRNEFTEDFVSARAIADGEDPYADTDALIARTLGRDQSYEVAPMRLRNPHTPAQIAAVRTVAPLSYRAARLVWLLFQSAAMAGAAALLLRELGWSGGSSVAAGIGSLSIPVVQRELVYGNVTGIVLLLFVLAWRGLRRGGDTPAGIALGAAAALRLFPLFAIIPLVRMRRSKAIAWQLGTFLVLSLAGVLVAGSGSAGAFRSSATANFEFWRSAPMNMSLPGISFRWLTDSFWHDAPFDAPGPAAAVASILTLACAAAALTTPARRSEDIFWSAAPWMVLASPLAWDRFAILVLPLVAVVVARAARRGSLPGIGVLLATLPVALGTLPWLETPYRDTSVPVLLFGYGLTTYGIAAFALMDALPARSPRPAPTQT